MKALGSSIALAIVGFTVTLLPTSVRAEIPMRISQAEEVFTLTVPDKDTTKSAYGGRLRRYDVHMGKIFSMTFQLCLDSNGSSDSFLWHYRAGNGRINMGTFRVDCESADGASTMVGMGRKKPTTIYRSSEGGVRDSVVMMVPVLDLSSEAKIDRWQSITTRFKPIR